MSAPTYSVIFENNDFVVVDKAANCNFHDEENLGLGLFNQVKAQGQYNELFPVHRLDKMTSGLLLFAKNKLTASELGKLFEQHLIEKFYLAISKDKPKKKQGWIKGDMVKSRRSSWRLARTDNNPAITQFFSYSLAQGKRLFVLRPRTGKTHQLRVALNSIGSAIAGDPIYNPADKSDRGYLHAFALKFELNGEQYQFSQMPSSGEFFTDENSKSTLANLQQPWLLNWPK
ncbi:RNA pseudouridine synthase [Thalassotalea sp. 42_200_T64]|nr:RNA pseudouridine synthase [Thalassotalea sp. 42_200_T64]